MGFVYSFSPHWHQLESISGPEQKDTKATSNKHKHELLRSYPLPQTRPGHARPSGGTWRSVLVLAGWIRSRVVAWRGWGLQHLSRFLSWVKVISTQNSCNCCAHYTDHLYPFNSFCRSTPKKTADPQKSRYERGHAGTRNTHGPSSDFILTCATRTAEVSQEVWILEHLEQALSFIACMFLFLQWVCGHMNIVIDFLGKGTNQLLQESVVPYLQASVSSLCRINNSRPL